MLSFVTVLCVIAYARPFLAKGKVITTRGGAEVVFVVDYSASMFLKDSGMARIDIVAREIKKTLSGGIIREGDRVAIIIFGKIVSPRIFLTRDLNIIATEADKIGRPINLLYNDLFWGTSVATAFKRVKEMLDRQDMFAEMHKESENWKPRPRQNRLVIFFSDGDFFNKGLDVIEKERVAIEKKNLEINLSDLKKRGVPVYAVGIGTRSNTQLLEILDDYKRGEEYSLELENELRFQFSRLNMDNMEYIASFTGARSFSIENFRHDASGFIKTSIEKHRSVFVQGVSGQEKQELWAVCLVGALMIFIFGLQITRF